LPVCFKQISLDRWRRAPFFEYQPFSSVPPIWRAASLFGSQQDAWSSNQVVVPCRTNVGNPGTAQPQLMPWFRSLHRNYRSARCPRCGSLASPFWSKGAYPWAWTAKNIQNKPAATPLGLIAGQQTRSQHHNLLTTNHSHHHRLSIPCSSAQERPLALRPLVMLRNVQLVWCLLMYVKMSLWWYV
jgi:hypothetical protein